MIFFVIFEKVKREKNNKLDAAVVREGNSSGAVLDIKIKNFCAT